MNISKFTQKSLQAVQDLEKTAYEFGNQEIEQEHLLYNLLHQDDSLILKIYVFLHIDDNAEILFYLFAVHIYPSLYWMPGSAYIISSAEEPLYCRASLRWAEVMTSQPSRSAMVLDTLSILW